MCGSISEFSFTDRMSLSGPVGKSHPDKRGTEEQDDVQKMFAVRMGKRSQEKRKRYLGSLSWLQFWGKIYKPK